MKNTPCSGKEKKSAKRFGVTIVGGSGYGAGELLRVLLAHPEIEVCSVTSRSHAGKPVDGVHSHLTGLTDLKYDAAPDTSQLGRYERGVIVLAMPTGQAVPAARELLSGPLPKDTGIIDLSGDLRLTREEEHHQFYPEVDFAADIRARFVYGLSELAHAEIAKARCVSNPGCLSTASILALAPLATTPLAGPVVIDAKTGTSGAGREPQAAMHHPARFSDFTAYKTLQHRHEPEIRQALGGSCARAEDVMFVPHLLPVSRGIFVTAYLTLRSPESADSLLEKFKAFYAHSPFIGFRNGPPRLVDVVGTNFCDISISVRDAQVVAMSAIDNLGKGMVGAAVQNMNLMFGLPQETGLLHGALGPV